MATPANRKAGNFNKNEILTAAENDPMVNYVHNEGANSKSVRGEISTGQGEQ